MREFTDCCFSGLLVVSASGGGCVSLDAAMNSSSDNKEVFMAGLKATGGLVTGKDRPEDEREEPAGTGV